MDLALPPDHLLQNRTRRPAEKEERPYSDLGVDPGISPSDPDIVPEVGLRRLGVNDDKDVDIRPSILAEPRVAYAIVLVACSGEVMERFSRHFA